MKAAKDETLMVALLKIAEAAVDKEPPVSVWARCAKAASIEVAAGAMAVAGGLSSKDCEVSVEELKVRLLDWMFGYRNFLLLFFPLVSSSLLSAKGHLFSLSRKM